MAVKRKYRLNLRNYGNLPAIMLSQYDEGYALEFEIRDGTDAASDLSAYTVTLKGTRADTLAYSFAGTISTNVLTFVIDTTMTACAGRGTAEIAIKDTANDVLFATFNMPVFVERAAVPEGSIDADVERAQEIAEQVQEIVDNAAAAVSGEAEKWATGQIDGTDVPSTDPAYENNAKYYAEQAADAAASIGIDATLTQVGKAADAKKTGDEISALKEELNDKAPLKYITDIAVITPTTYTQITKDSENVTAETGKKLSTSGAITSNGSYSYIAYEVTQNGLYYCTTGQSDSGTCVYSGLPLGASTLIKSASKSNFPTQANPWEVEAGQIVAVGSKTTAISQNIFLSGVGEASIPEIPVMQEDIKILEQGHCPITDIAPFQTGRYSQSDNNIHTSTTIACSNAAIQFDYDAVLIADIGYVMDIKLSSDGSTYTWNQHECAFFVPKDYYIKIAVGAIGGDVTVTDPTERGSHVKVINTSIPTSDYSRYHDSFFGIEMYNTVGFCGDSYTVRRSTYNNNWTTILAQTKGFTPTLYAHSGYATKAWIDNILPTLLADTPLDFYWLGLGINDASRILSSETYTVGSEADLTGSYTDYPDTFWGNYGKIIESIQVHAPNAHMVIATVIYHDMYTAQKNNESTNIPPINEAIRGIAEHYNIPLIELSDDIFYRSPEYQDNMQATAYTHPDPILFPGMANANARLFAKAVADNPAYFKISTSNT